MDERDDVESVIDRVAITELLVAAVSLVLRRPQNGDLERRILLLITEAVPKRVVLGRIVDDQDFDVVAAEAGGMRLSTFSIVVGRCGRR